MKVYIVSYQAGYNEFENLAVFDTKKKAQEFINNYGFLKGCWIEEHEMNDTSDALPN